MELPSKIIEQIAFTTRPRREEHLLIVMDKSTPEGHLSQPLQTGNKQFKVDVTFSTAYKGIFNIRSTNKKIYSKKSVTGKVGFIQLTISAGPYEVENLNDEKKTIFQEGHSTYVDHPFIIQPICSTLCSIIEISRQEPLISFFTDDNVLDLSGLNPETIYEKYNSSPNPVDGISFDNIFHETDIAQEWIVGGKRSGIFLALQ